MRAHTIGTPRLSPPGPLLCLAGLLLLAPAFSAHAADEIWPLQPVTMVLPSAAGNEDERLYAAFAAAFAERTGREMLLRPVPGRSGADAWAAIDAPGADDGHTLTAISFPNLTLRGRQTDSGVHRNVMVICAVTSHIPAALWAPVASPFTGLSGFIAQARKDAGKLLVAGNGSFTAGHFAWAALDRQAGITTIYLPHMLALEAAKAVDSNAAKAFWADAAALPRLQGKFRPLAVAAEKRSPAFPDTPTFKELGYNIIAGTFRGLALPKAAGDDNRESVAQVFSEIRQHPALRKAAAQLGFTLMHLHGAEMTGFLEQLETQAIAEAEEFGLTPP